jgi:acyl dehydratase
MGTQAVMRTFEVGERWSSGPKTMSVENLAGFSAQWEDDRTPHTDEAAAQARGFPTAIAQALMSHGYVQDLLVHVFGFEAALHGTEVNLAFIRPVYAGDTIVAHLSVRSVAEGVDRRWRVMLDAWCENQTGAQVAVGTAAVLI